MGAGVEVVVGGVVVTVFVDIKRRLSPVAETKNPTQATSKLELMGRPFSTDWVLAMAIFVSPKYPNQV